MLTLKEFLKLTEFIYRKTGIMIEEKKFNSLAPKFEAVMKKRGYPTFRAFFHDLRFSRDDTLMQEIINLVTINETYFFRENYQFETLIKYVLPELDKIRDKEEVIRILSAPSSTGEEAYSIALTLLDEGKLVEKRDFEIIGIDIDSNVIEKAKEGVYNKRSVQFVPPHLLRKYFTKDGENSYRISQFLRDAIDFRVVNVMNRLEMKRLGKFDIIFSRNMLIYFDEKSRREVALTFYSMLKPKGYLFLGHAESASRIVSVFKTKKLGDSIIYQKG
jgi:chemotaxis protein methyltransferase CheR